ncbi:hypothetical protein [Halogeometricum limi]|uniref:DUF8101 domain-containing protein n=1 Tax=Halogeometricum limi TaxID=555875 RepID=A0A1I6HWZ0_9EURY|nr:hypothetical protein [Halogeometricum limi]SFR58971.1 hypothetical protein SAMN04488124_2555 [Halogeometricum limi]
MTADAPEDVPADVRTKLSELFVRGADAARAVDGDTVDSVVDSVDTVVLSELPDGETKTVLLHGCDRVRRTAAAEPLVAAEYFEAMRRFVGE